MNNSLDVNLSIFLYRYMKQNTIININFPCIKENTINIDNNFKDDLKQRFKTLSLLGKNNVKGNL